MSKHGTVHTRSLIRALMLNPDRGTVIVVQVRYFHVVSILVRLRVFRLDAKMDGRGNSDEYCGLDTWKDLTCRVKNWH